MLRSFRFSNHRSFRDEAELLLLPADTAPTAVPVVAVYGANASGKSNLLKALGFMASAVSDSYARWKPSGGVSRQPFLLGEGATSQPSTFVVDVALDSVRHVYGFSVDDERVVEEWLYAYPRRRPRMILERTGEKVSFGPTVGDHRARADVLRELTRPNALILSLAAQAGQSEMMLPYRWFTERLRFLGATPTKTLSVTSSVMDFLAEAPHRRRQLVGLLRAADLGLRDILIDEGEHDVVYDDDHQPVQRVMLTKPSLRFQHGDNGSMDLRSESDGTVRWLWLLVGILRCLDDGGTAIVDELDASLHPELTARLIGLFQDTESNPRGAQLVFTTHDATLLGTAMGEQILHRDQVWFVEKDQDGSSRLYPLTDFHPRRAGENRERRYLGGSYGGLPVLSDSAFAAAVMQHGGVDGHAS